MTAKDYAAKLRSLQEELARDVAAKVAPQLTELVKAQYQGGVRTGATRDSLKIVPAGNGLRGIVGTPYARYLHGVFPEGLPAGGADVLDAAVREAVAQKLGGG